MVRNQNIVWNTVAPLPISVANLEPIVSDTNREERESKQEAIICIYEWMA